MRIETLAIGDELLDGRLADTNTRELADALSVLGLEVARSTIVPDDREAITDALREAAGRADVVVTSGGLGPTTDDITAECIAAAAGTTLRVDEAALQVLIAKFQAFGIDMPENNKRQVTLPSSCRILDNDEGTAPGFVTPLGGAFVWSFPGVPREYRHLFQKDLLPALVARLAATGQGGPRVVEKTTIRTLGIAESALGERLADLEAKHPDVKVQYRTHFPENFARLVVRGDDAAQVALRTKALVDEAVAQIGSAAYGVGDDPLEVRVVHALRAAGQTVALAESCTGGLVSKRLTDVPGSSAVVTGGVVAYGNAAKVALLDVDDALLQAHGAVSEEVAAAMARGARARLQSTWAIAVTGIAGPDGGTAEKPVGTVCFAISGPTGDRATTKKLRNWGRERIRDMSAAIALRMLLEALGGAR